MSLENCFKIYQLKIGSDRKVKKTAKEYIDKSKIVIMPKINYFYTKSSNIRDFVFSKHNSFISQMKKNENNRWNSKKIQMMTTRDPSIQNTLDIGKDLNESESISSGKPYKFPRLSNTPKTFDFVTEPIFSKMKNSCKESDSLKLFSKKTNSRRSVPRSCMLDSIKEESRGASIYSTRVFSRIDTDKSNICLNESLITDIKKKYDIIRKSKIYIKYSDELNKKKKFASCKQHKIESKIPQKPQLPD